MLIILAWAIRQVSNVPPDDVSGFGVSRLFFVGKFYIHNGVGNEPSCTY